MLKNVLHHVIFISGQDRDQIINIRNKALDIFHKNIEAGKGEQVIGEIIESVVNHFFSFAVYPDGGKEGHEISMDGDTSRTELIQYMQQQNFTYPERKVYFMEASFGLDNQAPKSERWG